MRRNWKGSTITQWGTFQKKKYEIYLALFNNIQNIPFGPSEMIQNNINGILVPVNDKLALSKAMSKVLMDRSYAKKLSSKGKQRSLDFSSDKIAAQYEKLINEVL